MARALTYWGIELIFEKIGNNRKDADISVAILAGGQSKRMGQDKAFIEVGGRPIIERILTGVKTLTDDVFISTNSPDKYGQYGLRIVLDRYPAKGALGGIYSALKEAFHAHVLVLGCDMPFVNIALLKYLIELAPTADIIVPLLKPQRPETLHAIYGKPCLPVIRTQLMNNQLRIIDFFDDLSVRYVHRSEIAKFDPHFFAFFNVNTPADWQNAQSIADTLDRSNTT